MDWRAWLPTSAAGTWIAQDVESETDFTPVVPPAAQRRPSPLDRLRTLLRVTRVDLRHELIRSKLGRRMLLLFLYCALLPTVAVAVLAFTEVTTRLQEQSNARLRQLSERSSTAIYERLVQLEREVGTLKSSSTGAREAARRRALALWVKSRLVGVTILDVGGKAVPVIGGVQQLPRLTPSQLQQVRAGHTIVTASFREHHPRVFLVRSLDPSVWDSPTVYWEVNTEYLWGVAELKKMGPNTELCVFDDTGRVFYCPLPRPEAFAARAAKNMLRSTSGSFDWETEGGNFLTAYSTVYLGRKFETPQWITLVARERSDILEPLARFKQTFPLVVLAALFLVLLFSITQIRRSLVPLEQLRLGTRRIASGEFAARVRLSSGDEFEELAASFNEMADQLGRQFNVLATIAEIDRAALSAKDGSGVVQALLQRIPSLCPCDALSVTVLDPKGEPVVETKLRAVHGSGGQRKELCLLTGDDLKELQAGSPDVIYSDDEDLPAYLRPLASEGARLFIALPIRAKDDLVGIIALGRSSLDAWDPDQLLQVRRLADQAAIGLSHMRMFEQTRFLAYYDSLTGLPNRVRFRQALEYAVSRSDPFAVFLLDLDNFKQINETLGHAAGDQLLRAVAKRLRETFGHTEAAGGEPPLNAGPIVARFGGDEFTILVTDIRDPKDAASVAARVLAMVEQIFMIRSREVFVTTSIGIAVSPLDGTDAETLLKNADAAMYHAKDQGRNGFQFYQESMGVIALHRLEVESKLRRAIERNELALHYQPIVDVESRRMVGVEALLRWPNPPEGLESPAEIISIAEESTLIVQLGEWVLREACSQGVRWQTEGLRPIRISVNVSVRQFRDESLVARVAQVLRETGLEPSHLVLELTESVLMERGRDSEIVDKLKALGAKISIDDFGTGYSSLSYLTQFPLDCLKIDRAFVRGLGTSANEGTITAAIVAMADGLSLKVVAEGVETAQELAFVRELGCEEIQGYIYSPAVDAETIAGFLRDDTLLKAPPRRRKATRRKPHRGSRPRRRRSS